MTFSTVFLRRWLFGCSGLVGATVLIGGATRLTNSGLSIVEWKPVAGIIPPITADQWEGEFAKYKNYPEFIQNPIDMDHFKYIYFYEWAHRVFARGVGFAFILPYGYIMLRSNLSRRFKGVLTGVLAGYFSQGLLGWYMVKSGMKTELLEQKQRATVSAYRLTSHLTLAVILFSALLTTAFRVPHANRLFLNAALPGNNAVRRLTNVSLGFVSISLISGGATAGLDAGMIYCDFPYMGTGILPPMSEIFTLDPWWRNAFENATAAQLWHKLAAITSWTSIMVLGIVAPKAEQYAAIRSLLFAIRGMAVAQVGLGIATLMLQTWIPMALLHQAGALVLILKLIRLRSTFLPAIL